MTNEELIDKACNWLRSVLEDDHVDSNFGINCIIPDIIICSRYFKVEDLITDFKKELNG